jgi:hypothetical protein
MACELRDVAAGLWLWRVSHPDWEPGGGWDPLVSSTCVESGGNPALTALLDLPFKLVLISHGEPVHDRAAYERALELAPWGGFEAAP